jgi:tetratricopeptide (TPR) repeat protein
VRRALLAVIALALAAAPARGDDEERDFDADAEEQSGFWERGVEPGRERYEDMIARGSELATPDADKDARARAAAIFRDAIRVSPGRALAHFWLGRIAVRDGDPAGCARSMEKALVLEPTFQAPIDINIPTEAAAAYELAVCQARAGDYEAAIEGLRRIVGQTPTASQQKLGLVHMRLGEATMALGRLDEAIESLSQATRLDPNNYNMSWLALAVAYDRDEDGARAREAMAKVLENDSRVDRLITSGTTWIPAHDAGYYLGLAYLQAGNAGRALYHFRRYLVQAGETLWAGRARVHLEAAQAGAFAGHDLKLRGSASLDPDKAQAAIVRADAAFQACLAATPDLLLTVSITRVVTAPPKRRHAGRGRPPELSPYDSAHQSGVRVLVTEQHGLKSDVLRAAVTCTESAASALSLPRPTGPEGTYAIAEFPVIRR